MVCYQVINADLLEIFIKTRPSRPSRPQQPSYQHHVCMRDNQKLHIAFQIVVVMGTRKCQNSNLRKIEQGKILRQIPINHGILLFKLLLEAIKPLRFHRLRIKLHIIVALLA
jgi:hypothetical protein